jgi:hypothetical protein
MYTRTGNRTGKRSSAQRLSFRNNFLRQSWDIVQPHNRQPRAVIPAMEDEWDFPTGIPHRLVNPVIGVPAFDALHL